MKIFKFGGAGINSIDRIKNLTSIITPVSNEPLVIIISAIGKTTNALEKVAEAFYAGNTTQALDLFDAVKKQHLNNAKYLLVTEFNTCLSALTDFFTEVEWLLHDKPVRTYDYYYDQIVCCGELLSTCIISHYLKEEKINNVWMDVRDIIRTDNNFRDANIDWQETEEKINSLVSTALQESNIVITQGFIGCTDDNESTTLGREGSDFTAAVFGNILQATDVTIWKDVEGVMNVDPKLFTTAQLLQELSYEEVIEMAFYGAQVIHPKTIKPLQNKKIPLFVKCFIHPLNNGTVIHQKNQKNMPPVIVIKQQQVLMHLTSKDFSFVGEALITKLYALLAELKMKPNLIQTGAINIQLCLDDSSAKTEAFASAAAALFDVQIEKGLQLITIRHYHQEIIKELLADKKIVLQQQTKETLQALFF